ncbi:hypothetical protein HanRHA438_Chr03g0100491 [Helianthus annuus]|nr:hypothetical protein HanRHA438_Chr03g0100491 [Helianthus annuus]
MTSTLVSCFLRFEVSFLADASSSSSFCNNHKKTVILYTQINLCSFCDMFT